MREALYIEWQARFAAVLRVVERTGILTPPGFRVSASVELHTSGGAHWEVERRLLTTIGHVVALHQDIMRWLQEPVIAHFDREGFTATTPWLYVPQAAVDRVMVSIHCEIVNPRQLAKAMGVDAAEDNGTGLFRCDTWDSYELQATRSLRLRLSEGGVIPETCYPQPTELADDKVALLAEVALLTGAETLAGLEPLASLAETEREKAERLLRYAWDEVEKLLEAETMAEIEAELVEIEAKTAAEAAKE